MRISPDSQKNRKRPPVIELTLVFVVAFVSIYGTTLFIVLRTAAEVILENFTKDPWDFIICALVAAAFITFIYYRDQRARVLVTSLEFNKKDRSLGLSLSRSFSDDTMLQTIPYDQLKYSVKNKRAFFLGYRYTVITIYQGENITGIINTAENWDGESLAVRKIIDQLKGLDDQE